MDEIVDDIGDVVNIVDDVRSYVLNAVVLLLYCCCIVVVLLLYCFKCRTPGRVAFVKSKSTLVMSPCNIDPHILAKER